MHLIDFGADASGHRFFGFVRKPPRQRPSTVSKRPSESETEHGQGGKDLQGRWASAKASACLQTKPDAQQQPDARAVKEPFNGYAWRVHGLSTSVCTIKEPDVVVVLVGLSHEFVNFIGQQGTVHRRDLEDSTVVATADVLQERMATFLVERQQRGHVDFEG